MKSKGKICLASVSGILFLALIYFVRNVDVAPIGAAGTEIGFSAINNAVHEFFGVNMFWYDLTEFFGIIALSIVGVFGFVGLIQLIKRKNLFKVDLEILTLGGLYLIVLGMYFGFEKLIINYRPILMPECTEAEASFPSSHTVLICVVMVSAVMLLDKYIKSVKLCKILKLCCTVLALVTIIGRFICGAHWFTDIIGGLLISVCLLSIFSLIISKPKNKHLK